jgi:hypothetical protein
MVQHNMIRNAQDASIILHCRVCVENYFLQHHRETRGCRDIPIFVSDAAAVTIVVVVGGVVKFPEVDGDVVCVALVLFGERCQEVGGCGGLSLSTVRGGGRWGGILAVERWHVVGVHLKVVDQNPSVVDGCREVVGCPHFAVDKEFEVVGARREGHHCKEEFVLDATCTGGVMF